MVSWSQFVQGARRRLDRAMAGRVVFDPRRGGSLLGGINLRVLRYLHIVEDGVEADGTPWVRLGGGPTLYGYAPTAAQRKLYASLASDDGVAAKVREECFGVALDIAQRYCMENGYFYNLPRSYYLKSGGCHIDVGAYIGFGAVRSALRLDTGRVIAVEMEPQNFALLERNVAENGLKNVDAFNCAVSDVDGGQIEYLALSHQVNTIRTDLNVTRGRRLEPRTIGSRTLDSIVTECGLDVATTPIFASLEINGAEPLALRGAERLLGEASSLYVRIAAPYETDEGSLREQVLAELRGYERLAVYDAPPQIVVAVQ